MRLAYVSYHVPDPEGTAAGRQLWAVCSALLDAGHDVTAWSWRHEPPTGPVPDWCAWRPLPDAPMWRRRARSLLAPRSDVVRAGWTAPDDAAVVADDPGSWPAVRGQGRSAVVTVHYAEALDRRALKDRSPATFQDWRGERRAVRQADLVWSLSDRVRGEVGRGTWVPPCVPLPPSALPVVEQPVVGLLANWEWRPNVLAADALVRAWPQVRAAVPGAVLLLAGRGQSPVGSLAGVQWLGEVPSSVDLLASTGLFAFPCPATSGPKMKVMDALSYGVAVLTTPAGAEGLVDGETAAAVSDDAGFVPRLVELLRDPAARARQAAAGRAVLEQHHAPAVAAQARLDALAGSVR